jgi:hypothetical protein
MAQREIGNDAVAARRESKSFSSGDCEFLWQLSEHVALAAHQAQLHSALQQAYDELRHTCDSGLVPSGHTKASR